MYLYCKHCILIYWKFSGPYPRGYVCNLTLASILCLQLLRFEASHSYSGYTSFYHTSMINTYFSCISFFQNSFSLTQFSLVRIIFKHILNITLVWKLVHKNYNKVSRLHNFRSQTILIIIHIKSSYIIFSNYFQVIWQNPSICNILLSNSNKTDKM
jgi:hypothetical protein